METILIISISKKRKSIQNIGIKIGESLQIDKICQKSMDNKKFHCYNSSHN